MSEARSFELERAAAHWQWAFDAADRALAADRAVLRDGVLRTEAHRLSEERRLTSELLERAATSYPREHVPWLSPTPVRARQLGLPPSTRACIFDLDGVLMSSDALHAAAWEQALSPVLLAKARANEWHVVPFDRVTDYHAYFDGRPRGEGIRLFLAGRGLHLTDAECDEIARRKGELVMHGLRTHSVAALPGALRYLQAAMLAHLSNAVLSASTTAGPMLDQAGLTSLVDTVVDAETIKTDGLRSRPAPDSLLRACVDLHVEPEDAVLLTHSGPGVVAAASVGMTALGVASGDEAEALRVYGASRVVESVSALLDPRLRSS